MKWSREAARTWYDRQAWPCGFNYLPRTAVNSTEMWQAETFDPVVIDQELGWAEAAGFNTCRVFLPFLVWQADPQGFVERLRRFLAIAQAHGLSTLPVLFDDCAFSGRQPYLGPQDDPVPGVHNSGWTPSPGHARVTDTGAWPALEAYVEASIGAFRGDPRVLAWDLYNEPGNGGMGEASLPLLEECFRWARRAEPRQPLTVGVWLEDLASLNAVSLDRSDVVSFHHYAGVPDLERQVERLRAAQPGRPLLCTEWMARTRDSRFETHLPYFHEQGIGCWSWGLVRGRTQTYIPWNSPQDAPEPETWFHDLYYEDGRPYCEETMRLLRRYLGKPAAV